jgi:hypothetical protein
MTDLSKLAATGTRLDLAIAEARGEVKVTRLPARKARKGERLAERVGGGGSRWHPAAVAPRDGGSRRLRGAAEAR